MADTLGKLALDLQQKTHDSRDIVEIQRTILNSDTYLSELEWCINHAKKRIPCDPEKCSKSMPCNLKESYVGSFFVLVTTTKEAMFHNVIRLKYTPLLSCPYPEHDTTLWRYNHTNETIEYLWSIPDYETCLMYLENAHMVDPEEHEIRDMAINMADGTFHKMANDFNSENSSNKLFIN